MKKYVLTLLLLVFCGCQDSLRFAPTESQRQTGELTYELATVVRREGTAPESPAAKQVEKGTRAAMVYMGRAKTPPDPEQFDTIATQATQDASLRPDVEQAAGSLAGVLEAVALLIGGGAGVKVVGYANEVRKRAKALGEVVAAGEKLKGRLDPNGVTAFKTAQDMAQSPETKKIVAEIRANGAT